MGSLVGLVDGIRFAGYGVVPETNGECREVVIKMVQLRFFL